MAPILCDICMSMLQSCEALGDHHPNITSFTNAAAIGCYICRPLLHYALKESGVLENCMVKPYQYRFYTGGAWTQIIIKMTMLKDERETEDAKWFWSIPNWTVAKDLSIRNRTSTIPLLEVTQNAWKWMSDCLDGHEICQKNVQPLSYPTRLLELGESTACIVLPGEKTISGPYAALSYCWGPNPAFFRLTASNLHELRAGILYSNLPTAFQEAINFVKSLSINYLWIDSLCIIQSGPGSIEDWRSESAKMQDVYCNCILNLSLSRSAHPDESYLNGFAYDTTPPFEVETTGIIGVPNLIRCTCTILSWDYYDEALYNQPLGFRAWALQERLLPPRVLSFGHGELFWDCKQLPNASESFPCGVAHPPNGLDPVTAIADLSHSLKLKTKAIPNTSDSTILESVWWEILEEYTDRELTYPEIDKLVALSAIATKMGDAMGDVYVAGHFWKTLPYSLNWEVQSDYFPIEGGRRVARKIFRRTEGDKSQRAYTTPSWSWASMDGPLFVKPDRRQIWLADAQDYKLIPVDETNIAGQVIFASLTIRAYCAEMEWTRGGPVIVSRPKTWAGHNYILKVNIDDPDDVLSDGARYIIAVLARFWTNKLEGLVLEEEKIESGERYRRMGHFSLRDDSGDSSDDELSSTEAFDKVFGREKKKLTLI